MRVAVTGGRDYADRAAVYRALDAVRRKHSAMVLVHGGARGADTLADEWAHDRGVPVEVFPADWEQHGKRAGPLRNVAMARSGLGGCIAFPGGSGTAHMVATCVLERVPVWHASGLRATL